MCMCKLITNIVVGSEFLEAWYYMPILLLGTAFFSMAQYLGSIYTASKNTKMAFVTNASVAILNIFLNIIWLKYIGPIGAAIATAICYLILWIYRAIDTRKMVEICYDFKSIITTVLLLIVNTIIITMEIKLWYIYSIILLALIVFINRKRIISFTRLAIGMIKEKIKIRGET